MNDVYISLGSNLGDREEMLNYAITTFKTLVDNHLTVSHFYETDPVGYLDQDAFLNCVICLQTTLDPFQLLEVCQHIETELERVRVIRWGPRTIDCDIILYGSLSLFTETLTIPHPRYRERAFVLVPLIEICRDTALKSELISVLATVEHQQIRKLENE